MKPRTRRRLGLALLAAAAVAGILAIGWFPQEPLRRLAEARLRAALGPGSSLGGLHVVPGSLTAVLRDLILEGPTYRIQIPRARLALAPETLLGGALSLRFLQADDIRMALRPAAAAPNAPAAAPLDMPLVVRNLQLRVATLIYDDPLLEAPVRIEGLSLEGGLGSGSLRASLARGTWARQPAVTFTSAAARLRISPRLEIVVDSFEARTAGSWLSLHGTLGRVGALTPSLEARARLDAAELAAWTGTTAAGALDVEGRLQQDETALRARLQASGRRLSVAGWPVAQAQLELSAEEPAAGKPAGGRRASLRVRVDALGGRASGEARVAGTAVEGRLQAADLDLAALGPRLGLAPGELAGAGDAELRVSGDLERSLAVQARASADGRSGPIRFAATLHSSGSVQPRQPRADLAWSTSVRASAADAALSRLRSATLALEGTARGRWPPRVEGAGDARVVIQGPGAPEPLALRLALRSEGSRADLDLRGQGWGGTLAASAQLQDGDWRRLSLAADALSLERLVEGGRGLVRLRFEGAGPLASLSGRGEARVAGLALSGVDAGDVRLSLDAAQGEARLQLEAPRLATAGSGTLRTGPRAGLEARIVVAGLALETLQPLLPPGTPLEGRAAGAVDILLPALDPRQARVEARIASLEARSGTLWARSTRPLRISATRAGVVVEELALEGPGLSLVASGGARLDAEGTVDARLQADVDLARLPVPPGWTLAGTARAEVTISGTRRRPRAAGVVSGDGVAAEGPSLPPTQLAGVRLELTGDGVEIRGLSAGFAGGALTLSGRVPLASVWPQARARPDRLSAEEQARLDLTWEGVELGTVLARLRPGATPVAASLAGALVVEGGLARLGEMRATLTTPEIAAQVEDRRLTLRPARVALEAGRLEAGALVLDAEGGSVTIAGAVDLERRRVDASGRGTLDLRALSPFVEAAALTGSAEIDVAVAGPLDAPQPRGSVRILNGTLRPRALPQALTEIQATLALEQSRVEVREASAVFGGGRVTLAGGARIDGAALSDVRLEIRASDVALRYPEGLRSQLRAELSLAGRSGALLLAGKVAVERGLYDVETALRDTLSAPVIEPEPSPLLRSIALDLQLVIERPIVVRSIQATLQASGELRLRGDLETPAPFGRIAVGRGGKLRFQAREFDVDRGTLTYAGSWDPELSIEASASRPIRDRESTVDYDVSLHVRGTLETPDLDLRATPSLSDEQIFNLLAEGTTGRSGLAGAGLLAGETVGSFLTSRLTGGVARGLQGLGLGDVTLQPFLIGRSQGADGDVKRRVQPGARFTFTRQLARGMELLYSLSLSNANRHHVLLTARPWRSLSLSAERREDGSVTAGVGQRLRFGGPRRERGGRRDEPQPREKVTLTELRLSSELAPGAADPRRILHVRTGKDVTIWTLQEEEDRVRDAYRRRGYLDAEASARLEGTVASLTVRSGPRYRWRVTGLARPPDLQGEIGRALFAEEALENGRRLLLERLRSEGLLRAEVRTQVVDEDGGRTLLFEVAPGPLLRVEAFAFPGATVFTPPALLEAAGGAAALLAEPQDAVERLKRLYRGRYFLAVEVDAPQSRERDGAVSITVPIREGTRARIAALRFEGASQPEATLAAWVGLQAGSPYSDAALRRGLERLRERYFSLGYPDLRIDPRASAAGADVDVQVGIVEGERVTVGSIELVGLSRTREGLVRSRIPLRPGDPLDPRLLTQIEDRLLELGVFSQVRVTALPGTPATVRVEVREQAALRLEYALRYNSEDKTSGLADAGLRNLFGRGITAGASHEAAADSRDSRASLEVPSLLRRGRFHAGLFRFAKDVTVHDIFNPEVEITNTQVQKGLELRQVVELGRWQLQLGYEISRRSSTLFPKPLDTAVLDVSVVRDTRDSPLDTRHGRFLSLNLEYAPPGLGSDFTFVKGFAQAFVSWSFRPWLTWAQGYRLGLARGFAGQRLASFDRFQAGGAYSVRGYANDSLGPEDFLGNALGGEAVVVLNQELRLRHERSGIGAALFYDAGNVFDEARGLSFDWRHAVGVELRYQSPVLLRLDLGLPLNRRPGDGRVQVFFSIGQAF